MYKYTFTPDPMQSECANLCDEIHIRDQLEGRLFTRLRPTKPVCECCGTPADEDSDLYLTQDKHLLCIGCLDSCGFVECNYCDTFVPRWLTGPVKGDPEKDGFWFRTICRDCARRQRRDRMNRL